METAEHTRTSLDSPDAKIGDPAIVLREGGVRNRVSAVFAATGTLDAPPDVDLSTRQSRALEDSLGRTDLGETGGSEKKLRENHSGVYPAAPREELEKTELVPPTRDVRAVLQMLRRTNNIYINAPHLYPTEISQAHYRAQRFTPKFCERVLSVRGSASLALIPHIDKPSQRVEAFYGLQGDADVYSSGLLTPENLYEMHGYGDISELFAFDRKGDLKRKRTIELAAGDGAISRVLRDIRDQHFVDAYIRTKRGGKRRPPGNVTDEILRAEAITKLKRLQTTCDEDITAVDMVPAFAMKARENGINGIEGNLCLPSSQFFEQTGLIPNSFDTVYVNLALDRFDDLPQALTNIRLLAKMDKSTRFLIGFYAPFSCTAKGIAPGKIIPPFDAFDPNSDFRRRWVNLPRVETIYRIIADLNLRYKFNTHRVAEHPYEVYSVQCIIETAKTLREDPDFEFLRTYDFQDAELNALRDAVFSGEMDDDVIVAFPERENVILIAGYITGPEDGAHVRKAA